MTTSQDTFPQKLTEIDDLTRSDHSHLSAEDRCYFIGEYTARKGFTFSATNQLVLNFKKSVDRKGRSEWQHKEKAIKTAGKAFSVALGPSWLTGVTLVPMPPSKKREDPLYDDRMLRMLRSIPYEKPLDIRELLTQPENAQAAHDADVRPRPEDIAAGYVIDDGCCAPPPRTIAIFDDVITTGAHFVAARRKLAERFPNVAVYGLFIARRVPETTDFSEFFGEIEGE